MWWELRDGSGALPCSMWREDWDALGLRADRRRRPGRRRRRLRLLPRVAHLVARVLVRRRPTCGIAGEGDLLAQLARLRRRLEAEGLFEPQKRLPRPALPRCIGVVTGESGKARDDVAGRAAPPRLGRAARVGVRARAGPPRRAGAITRALQDLAACEEVEVIVVARGGGSLTDLFAFCDETLCRTVVACCACR